MRPGPRGQDITGPDGLLKPITTTVLQAALEEEMTNAAGEVQINVPRDPAGTFDPGVVRKR